MKSGAYKKLRDKILSKYNSNEVNLSELHYARLVREACSRDTSLEKSIQIKEELSLIRMLRKDINWNIAINRY